MQDYICTVKKENGTLIKKYTAKAEDTTDLFAQLKANHLYLVEYRAKEKRKDIVGGNKITLSVKDVAVLCRQLASMLTAGVTLVKALNILYQQIEKKNSKESIKRLYESVQRGDQFSEAIRKQTGVYPEIMISMIEAGEASGQLDSVITKLANQFESDVRLKAKIKTAMTYPAILVVLSISVVLLLVTQILPIFLGMFTADMEMPLPTQILINFSAALQGYWYLFLLGIGLLVMIVKSYLSTEKGLLKWHTMQMKIPVLGPTIMKISAVRFSRTMSTLLSSGMNLLPALDIVVKVVGNRVIMNDLNVTKEDIKKGMSLSQSLRKITALPPLVHSMVGIGEESGSIESVLEKCADYYDNEVDNSIQKLVSMIEPIMIIVMGGMVGFIIIGMLLPIFSIYESIG